MARVSNHFHGNIGYGVTQRGPRLGVLFVDPQGRRLERMTRFTKPDADYHAEAKRIIDGVYTATAGKTLIGWDDAFKQLEDTARDLSPKTLEGYRKVLAALRRTLGPCFTTPAEITPELATRFARLFLLIRR